MRDRNFGWTVEMQVKAALRGPAGRGGGGRLSAPHRPEQGERHPVRHRARGGQDPRHPGPVQAPARGVTEGRPGRAALALGGAALVLSLCVLAWARQGDQTRDVAGFLLTYGLAFAASLVAAHASPGLSAGWLRVALGLGPRLARRPGLRSAPALQRRQPPRLGRPNPAPRRQPLRLGRPAERAPVGAAAGRGVRRPEPRGLHRRVPAALADGGGGRGAASTTACRP